MKPERLDHLDADVIAAWFEGTLESDARAAAEAHAADCASCQAVLAAMVRSEAMTAQPKGAWFRAPFRWAVPLAAATAALAIWVAVDENRPAPAPAPPVVATRTAAAPDAAERSLADRAASAPPASASESKFDEFKRERKAPEAQTKSAPRRRAEGDQPSARNEAERSTAKTAVLAETVETRRQELPRDAAASRASQRTPAASPVPPLPPASPPPQAAAGSVQQQQQQQQQRVDRLGAVAYAAKEIASPDLAVRWRIGPGATIERSPDGGRTWVAQPSGVTGELVAASAPSADVCWVVGRAGIVLLSTDSATWRRLPFPETTDLRSVTAIDARIASVTAVDGRVFRTTDGGVTWRREDAQHKQ